MMTEGEAKNKTQELRLVAIGQRISELKKEGKTFRKKQTIFLGIRACAFYLHRS
jgi:hypothetical protein